MEIQEKKIFNPVFGQKIVEFSGSLEYEKFDLAPDAKHF